MKWFARAALALLIFSGLRAGAQFDAAPFAEARRMIREGSAECVVIRDGKLHAGRGRGVMPLLDFSDRTPELLRGATVVDKVIGRAAAALLIAGGARAVFGETMSADAREFLEKHGVAAGYGKLVPRILNFDRSDLCPLEKSVAGIDDPAAAVAALRRRVAELRRRAPRK